MNTTMGTSCSRCMSCTTAMTAWYTQVRSLALRDLPLRREPPPEKDEEVFEEETCERAVVCVCARGACCWPTAPLFIPMLPVLWLCCSLVVGWWWW